MLKTEGTKHKLVLIPLAHRGSSKGRDELFEADPWANCGSKQQRQNRAKKVPTKTNNAVGRVDLFLFHDDKQPVSQVDLNQLFKVIAVCLTDVTEFGSHLPSVLRGNTSVSAAGALLVGRLLRMCLLGLLTESKNVLSPVGLVTTVLPWKAVLVNCGDKPISLFKEANLNVTSAPADHQGGIEFFLKAIGFANVMAITQTWSQSYFKKGHKVSPESTFTVTWDLKSRRYMLCFDLVDMTGFFPRWEHFKRPTTRHIASFNWEVTVWFGWCQSSLLPAEEFGLTRSRHEFWYQGRVRKVQHDET